jgi:hypothetical protein
MDNPMTVSLRSLPFFLFLLPALCTAQNLDTILELNAKAVGGSDNWSKIENVRIQIEIKEADFEVTGTYVATRGGSMRIDIKAGEQAVFSEGLYQGEAWQWTPDGGIEPQDEFAAATLKHGIDLPGRFFSLKEARNRGAKISLEGSVLDGDRSQWHVRVVLEDGFALDYFIDQETSISTRQRDYRAFHPAIDATKVPIETRYQTERWTNGVLSFDRSDNSNVETNEWMATTQVHSLEHNVELAANYFQAE